MSDITLCRLDDIEDPGSRGFVLLDGGTRRSLFVVRVGEKVVGYLNDCPHRNAPLDWRPDRFLDADRQHILCSSHGALFRIDDGVCISGPCPGKALTPIPIRIENGLVLMTQ